MEWRWDHEIPCKYDKPIDSTRNRLSVTRDHQAESARKKYGRFAIWCEQKQLAKAYWHGASRVIWKGLCPKNEWTEQRFFKAT